MHCYIGSLLAHALRHLAGAAVLVLAAAYLNLVAHGFLFVFGHAYVQNTILEAGLNAAGLYGVGQLTSAVERAK